MTNAALSIVKMVSVETTVRVSIRTESGTMQADVSMEDFADAVFGKSERPCAFKHREGKFHSMTTQPTNTETEK